jgi:hypothetical protein
LKPVFQTKFSTPDGKVKGNCFRACLASLAEVDIDSIPVIEDMSNEEWHKPFFEWLHSVGLDYTGIKDKPSTKDLLDFAGVDGYIIVAGKSPRPYVKAGHGVVFYKDKMVHDPHPSNDGILDIDHFYYIERKEPN